ncbi:MAG: hypothetical protein HRT81_09805 [Henriciella sp.]|nr:hypothetical protein [Henriciella sp.]
MSDENSVLENLSLMRVDLTRLADRMDRMSVEMRATLQHVAGLVALQDHDHVEITQIKLRLDRIERRLNLAD